MMKPEESIKDPKEFTNKYDNNNPYYKDEKEFVTRLTDEEKEINDKRVKSLEEDINYPTQEEIIAYNRKENQNKEKDNTTVLVEKDFLEKLKDFEYWKEWKNQ